MKAFSIFALLILLFTGCSKSSVDVAKNYSGDVLLTTALDVPLSGRLHIRFSGANFDGATDSTLLVYIGSGAFKISADSIYFTQTEKLPDNYDPVSILEGGFKIEENSDSLVFSRKNPGGYSGPEVTYRLHQD